MDVVNPGTEIQKLVSSSGGSGIVAEDIGSRSYSEKDVKEKSENGDTSGEGRGQQESSQSVALSVNINKTIDNTTDTMPIIPQMPDLSTAPSLRGRIAVEGSMHKCQGVWAMNDKSHSVPGQTSDFEFKLVFPGIAPPEVPVDGRYSGWFMIKNPQKNISTKVEDKDLDLKFMKKDNSSDYDVTGTGVNKFGKFSIQGTLKSNNMIQLYKIYQPKRTPGATPRGSIGGSPRPRGVSSQGRQSLTAVSSPRESSSRIRRPSLALAESLAPPEKPIVNKPSLTQQRSSSKQQHKASASVATSRASRPAPFVSRCKDLLKDIMKQVSAVYFAEPVDPVRLGIPDYPSIIKEPMDFSTIRTNLDRQVYKNHEMFSEHMRLVFKNAVTYNVRRDNPVHIAARELSDMFEEKYRIMVTHLNASTYTADTEVPPAVSRQASSAGRKSGGKGRGRASHGGGSGPRAMDVAAPPALDGSMQQMMIMHQKMLDMEQELNSLRTAVRQTEIRTSLDQQRVAAQIPLSYDEKKALIENIQRLDGDQITAVVDIIQSAMPSTDCGGEGDEVEIPMDELDTYTLRQLQDYVHSVQQQAINVKRKRQSMSNPSSAVRTPRGKKSKSSAIASENMESVFEQPDSVLPAGGVASDLNDDSLEDFSILHGRKRSNSLDLFPSDDMEQDPVVTSDVVSKNFDAWTAPSGVETSDSGGNVSGSWSDAVSERKDTLHRELELKAESEKIAEKRAKIEFDRNDALQRVYKEQTEQTVNMERNHTEDLLVQRELERSERAEMTQTVKFDQSQDALYRESLDL